MKRERERDTGKRDSYIDREIELHEKRVRGLHEQRELHGEREDYMDRELHRRSELHV